MAASLIQRNANSPQYDCRALSLSLFSLIALSQGAPIKRKIRSCYSSAKTLPWLSFLCGVKAGHSLEVSDSGGLGCRVPDSAFVTSSQVMALFLV